MRSRSAVDVGVGKDGGRLADLPDLRRATAAVSAFFMNCSVVWNLPPVPGLLFAAGKIVSVFLAEKMQTGNLEIRRYARHLALPEVGYAGQQRLQAASVLVIGAIGNNEQRLHECFLLTARS